MEGQCSRQPLNSRSEEGKQVAAMGGTIISQLSQCKLNSRVKTADLPAGLSLFHTLINKALVSCSFNLMLET